MTVFGQALMLILAVHLGADHVIQPQFFFFICSFFTATFIRLLLAGIDFVTTLFFTLKLLVRYRCIAEKFSSDTIHFWFGLTGAEMESDFFFFLILLITLLLRL